MHIINFIRMIFLLIVTSNSNQNTDKHYKINQENIK